MVVKEVQKSLPKGINIDVEFDGATVLVAGKKNYIIIHNDGRVELKGKFASRDRTQLEKEFYVGYIKASLEGKESEYFSKLEDDIINRRIPLEKLTITRTIRKGEKQLSHLGKEGERVTYYFTMKNGQPYPSNNGDYDISYYIKLLKSYKEDIDKISKETTYISVQ